ncbi:MAG: class I SAM-dependent methyltransferase [Bdellovibrionales bacterium]|nr:class I SAM-dependent methyltransferase [Bdellovibrionales bacterium]
MNFIPKEIENYALKRSKKPSALLDELWAYTHAHTDAPQMLTGPLEGNFLHMLVSISGAKRVLEIGTFTGYSALWMAQALPADGKLITCDVSENNVSIAKQFFEKSEHGSKITIQMGPGLKILQKMIESGEDPFDVIFVDADKENYPRYFQKSLELIKNGGLMVFDNTLWSGRVLDEEQDAETKGIDRLNIMIENEKRVQNVLLTIRDGMQLVRKV